MQEVSIKLQKDAKTNAIALFKQNVNSVSVDKTTGARTPVGNTMFVFRTEMDAQMNIVTGKAYAGKQRQAIFRLEHLDTNKANKWIKKRLKQDTIDELNALGLSDLFTNPESLNQAYKLGLELLVDIHIAKQEFALNLVKFKAGKEAECLASYKQALARYADSPIFQARFTNHLLQAVISVDRKLVDDKGALRDTTTGQFNFALVETLEKEQQAQIASAIDTVMFGKKTDKAIINGKLKRLPNFGAHLVSKQGEYIVSYDFPLDSDEALALYPDILIDIDTDNQALKAFQAKERQARSAVNFDQLAEQEAPAKKDKKVKKLVASLPSEESEESDDSEE